MNKQNFELQDRFPLSTQGLTFIQDMILAVSQLSLIGGKNYILSGCETNGNNVSSGIIVVNGELMPFEGGTKVDTIAVIETVESVTANGLTFDSARVRRKAQFASGSGPNYYPWSDFKPLLTNLELDKSRATIQYVDDEIKKIVTESIPSGIIVMWSGSEAQIPEGWALCDGREVAPNLFTPNLSGKFVVGFNRNDGDYDGIGKTGGKKEVMLIPEEIPAHSHQFMDYYYAESKIKEGGQDGYKDAGKNTLVGSNDTDSDNRYLYYMNNETKTFGKGLAHENRPPYYVLAYIIKL